MMVKTTSNVFSYYLFIQQKLVSDYRNKSGKGVWKAYHTHPVNNKYWQWLTFTDF